MHPHAPAAAARPQHHQIAAVTHAGDGRHLGRAGVRQDDRHILFVRELKPSRLLDRSSIHCAKVGNQRNGQLSASRTVASSAFNAPVTVA